MSNGKSVCTFFGSLGIMAVTMRNNLNCCSADQGTKASTATVIFTERLILNGPVVLDVSITYQ